MNGPSVSSVSPFWTRTVVALSAGASCPPPTTPGSSRIARYSSTIACRSSSESRSNSSTERPG